MSTLSIKTARVFAPLLQPSRYKGAHGGRGSGKSHFFAELLVDESMMHAGLRSVCIREVQKDLKDSAKLLIEDKIQRHGLGRHFNCLIDRIETPGGGQIIFRGMQDYNSESIKSLEGFDRAWIEEAHTLSQRSLTLLRPTIRKEGSEIWASWNPRRKSDAVDEFLRGSGTPADAIVVQANWSDSPFFPAVLESERLTDLARYPEQYPHVWDGDYVTAMEGAYYASALNHAKLEGRIGFVAADPLMTIRAYWDIGGTGAKADACAIWIVQFVGTEIRLLNYYEASGQPLASHVNWLRSSGYDACLCVLPHDGAANDKVYQVSYESALRSAGFDVRVVPNMGAGAATLRIEAARRLFPSMRFNADTTAAGRDALGWYHEKKDEARNIGLGPAHDWASHGADAFGLIAVDHAPVRKGKPLKYNTDWVT